MEGLLVFTDFAKVFTTNSTRTLQLAPAPMLIVYVNRFRIDSVLIYYSIRRVMVLIAEF